MVGAKSKWDNVGGKGFGINMSVRLNIDRGMRQMSTGSSDDLLWYCSS